MGDISPCSSLDRNRIFVVQTSKKENRARWSHSYLAQYQYLSVMVFFFRIHTCFALHCQIYLNATILCSPVFFWFFYGLLSSRMLLLLAYRIGYLSRALYSIAVSRSVKGSLARSRIDR